MAKELPYFKFEPNQWENGNIQICSKEDKGLFIDVCCMYWSRLGELPFKLVIQKLCNGNANALQGLIDAEIIGINNDLILIDFLDNQLNEFQETSEKRANAANKRWKNASAMQVQCKSNAIREEKRREKKRKEDNRKRFTPPAQSQVFDYLIEKVHSKRIAEIEAEKFFNHYTSNDWKVGKNKMKDWQAAARGWIGRIKDYSNNGYVKKSNEIILEHPKNIVNPFLALERKKP